jgi:hypothetical protein
MFSNWFVYKKSGEVSSVTDNVKQVEPKKVEDVVLTNQRTGEDQHLQKIFEGTVSETQRLRVENELLQKQIEELRSRASSKHFIYSSQTNQNQGCVAAALDPVPCQDIPGWMVINSSNDPYAKFQTVPKEASTTDPDVGFEALLAQHITETSPLPSAPTLVPASTPVQGLRRVASQPTVLTTRGSLMPECENAQEVCVVDLRKMEWLILL